MNKNMVQKLIKTNGVKICTECFGEAKNPAVLLIMGATASMLYWHEEFCKKLAEQGFFVIRYDNRDVGRSTTYPLGNAPYDIVDLVDDAVGILKAYEIESAHFFGMSLGGMIAQIAALKYSAKVLSLTLFATGPWADSDPTIPSMDTRIIDFQAKAMGLDWSDKQAVVSHLVEGAKLMTGQHFDGKRFQDLFSNEFERSSNYLSMFNHATLQGGEEFYGRINQIDKKCLIIHGDSDIIWNYGHALFLKRTLNNSRLVTLAETGHELNPKDWDVIINAFSEENSTTKEKANKYL
jgi:pimeloyl-ACP methyl ester carboxylesterase